MDVLPHPNVGILTALGWIVTWGDQEECVDSLPRLRGRDGRREQVARLVIREATPSTMNMRLFAARFDGLA
jgi:hypothetical protein